MFLARASDVLREPQESGERGTCPGCGSEVLARCGEIVTWHWAHVVDAECDAWHEPEGAWHRAAIPVDLEGGWQPPWLSRVEKA